MFDDSAIRREQLREELLKLARVGEQTPIGSSERERVLDQMEPLYRLIFALGEELDER